MICFYTWCPLVTLDYILYLSLSLGWMCQLDLPHTHSPTTKSNPLVSADADTSTTEKQTQIDKDAEAKKAEASIRLNVNPRTYNPLFSVISFRYYHGLYSNGYVIFTHNLSSTLVLFFSLISKSHILHIFNFGYCVCCVTLKHWGSYYFAGTLLSYNIILFLNLYSKRQRLFTFITCLTLSPHPLLIYLLSLHALLMDFKSLKVSPPSHTLTLK